MVEAKQHSFRLDDHMEKLFQNKVKELKFPNPKNPKELINFVTDTQFIRFALRCIMCMPDHSWKFFSHEFNPDYINTKPSFLEDFFKVKKMIKDDEVIRECQICKKCFIIKSEDNNPYVKFCCAVCGSKMVKK